MSRFRDWQRSVGFQRAYRARLMAARKITSAKFLNRAADLRRAGDIQAARDDVLLARRFRLAGEMFPQVAA